MSRRNLTLLVVGVVLTALAVGVYARTSSGVPADRLVVAGDVRVDSRTVVAPSISYPQPDYTVGIPTKTSGLAAAGGGGSPKRAPAAAQTRSNQPIVSGKLIKVSVRAGQMVKAGQVLAQLDTTFLNLGVKQAKVNAARARTTVRVLGNSLDKILDNIDKLATGRETLATARDALAKGKAALNKAKVQLLAAQAKLLEARRNRPKFRAALAALEKQAAMFPPGHVPPPILQKIAQLRGLLAVINPGLAKIAAGLQKVAAGEALLATGEAKLNAAASQLNTAADALATAKSQVTNARDTLKIVADSQHVGIDLAELKRDQATIVSPVDGIVTYAIPSGTVAMVGTPIVRIQPAEATLIDTYLTPDQLQRVHLGSPADVSYDSAPGKVLHGTLAIVGTTALYPPTSFPTDIVHMTRTVKITIRLDSGDAPPQGTPVDISIHTN